MALRARPIQAWPLSERTLHRWLGGSYLNASRVCAVHTFMSSSQAELSYESRVLEQEAAGLVFPRTLNSSARYEGTWVLRTGVDSRDVGFNLVPNRTLRYMVPSIAARIASTFPLPSTSGGAAMIVESYPIFDAVLGVQVRSAVLGAVVSCHLTSRCHPARRQFAGPWRSTMAQAPPIHSRNASLGGTTRMAGSSLLLHPSLGATWICCHRACYCHRAAAALPVRPQASLPWRVLLLTAAVPNASRAAPAPAPAAVPVPVIAAASLLCCRRQAPALPHFALHRTR